MDTPVAPPGGEPYPSDMVTRVVILEEVVRHHKAVVERMDRRFEASDHRFEELMAEHRADFRWLLGGFATMVGAFGAMLAVMAHGFHWL